MQGSSTVGSVTHEGVTYSSNTNTDAQIRASLGIAETPTSDAPAEPEIPAESATPADATSATGDQPIAKTDQQVSEERPAKRKDPQARIDKITFEREEARREAARVRQESQAEIARVRAEFQAQIDALKPKEAPAVSAKPAADGEPKLEDYADRPDPYAAWMRDLAKFDLKNEMTAREQAAEKQRQEHETHQRQFAREQSERERLQTFGQKIAKAVEANPELQQAFEAAGDLPISRPMADALIESDAPERVMAYLAQHTEDCVRIANLPPLHAFREITRLDARLESAASPGSAPAKPKTQAHAPISPVGGAHAAPSDGPPDPKTCTQEQFDAYWNQQEQTARRAAR